MHHTETVNTETFEQLSKRQRYLILKHDPLLMPGDILVVNEQDTRNQLSFEIDAIVPLHSRASVLSLYAPYTVVQDVPDEIGGWHGRTDVVNLPDANQ